MTLFYLVIVSWTFSAFGVIVGVFAKTWDAVGSFSNFIILDFLDLNNENCIEKLKSFGSSPYICDDLEWYLSFLKKKDGKINIEFVKLYLKYLKVLSSEKYLDNFFNKHLNEVDEFNSAVYQENSKKDVVFYKGISDYIF